MTVKQLIELLQKHPQDAEVWYKDDFYGDLNRQVEDYDLEVMDGKVVIGYHP